MFKCDIAYACPDGQIDYGCAVCGQLGHTECGTAFIDEVSGTIFCAAHAGPLRWSAHDVDAYSLALRIAGEYDVPLPLPRIASAA